MDPRGELTQRYLFDGPRNQDDIGLVNAISGMCDPQGQVAIVGEDHETLGVGIETPGRVHAFRRGDEFNDRWPSLRVVCGTHRADGLVDKVRRKVRRQRQRQPVDLDSHGGRIDLLSQVGRLTVDQHAAVPDENFSVPSRGVARAGDQLLESFDDPSGRKGRSSVSTISAGGT